MEKQYRHLSRFERGRIFEWHHCGNKSIREIGRLLGRSHATISREIKRNKYMYHVPTYYPNIAQNYYEIRMRDRSTRLSLKSKSTRKYIIKKIKLGWSPEIISGRLRDHQSLKYVNYESIYQFIYREAKSLIECLPRKHKKRRPKYPKRKYSPKISQKTSILDRPECINTRAEVGHWESDSVESKHRDGGLNVLIERVTRLVKISKLKSKKSAATNLVIINKLSKLPPNFIKSITYDNGSENAGHLKINEIINCDSYFCQPYHSWEKGSVEQVNGLIRRYLPKGTDMKLVHSSTIKKIENLLNNRPRKCLDYKTPIEVYNEITNGALPY